MAINPLQQTGSIAVSVAEGSLLHALEFALDRLKGMLGETQPLPTMPDSTLALFPSPSGVEADQAKHRFARRNAFRLPAKGWGAERGARRAGEGRPCMSNAS